MDCQQFNKSFQTKLDGNRWTLPAAAERHCQICDSCRLLYTQMLELQKAIREAPEPKLSPHAETLLTHRIAEKIAPPKKSAQQYFWYGLSDIIKGLRWERVFLTSALATVSLLIILRLSQPDTLEVTNLQAGSDIEILLEEHAIAMENGIFQGTSHYANFLTTTEQE